MTIRCFWKGCSSSLSQQSQDELKSIRRSSRLTIEVVDQCPSRSTRPSCVYSKQLVKQINIQYFMLNELSFLCKFFAVIFNQDIRQIANVYSKFIDDVHNLKIHRKTFNYIVHFRLTEYSSTLVFTSVYNSRFQPNLAFQTSIFLMWIILILRS